MSWAQILAHVELELPWVLLLLPAPLLVWLLLPAYRERQESVRIPFFEDAAAATGRKPSSGAVVLRLDWLQRILAPLVWALIVVAVARPVWVEDPIEEVQAADHVAQLLRSHGPSSAQTPDGRRGTRARGGRSRRGVGR
jgi:Ca-activated chloride channel family protein